jgi:hypothetical protein
MLKSKSKIPKIVSYCALSLIKGSLRRKCGHDVLSCAPIDHVKNIKTPSLFVIGDKDDMVLYKKFLKMFDKCNATQKKLVVQIDGEHPSTRSEECIDQIFDFMNAEKLTESEMKQGRFSDAENKGSLDEIFYDTPSISKKTLETKSFDTEGFSSY